MVKKQTATRESMSSSTTSGSTGGGVLCFDCKTLIAGIMFHLVDEGIALSIDTASGQRTMERLREAQVQPCVARSVWASMSNEDRLQWLLMESKTCAVLSGGVATLGPLRTQVIS